MSAFGAARAARDAAKAALVGRIENVRDDLKQRGIGGRIVDRITGDAADAALEAVDIVETNKVVVFGTLATIMLWFLRNPIVAAIRRLSARISKRGPGVWS